MGTTSIAFCVDPALGPVQPLKLDISDRFYRVNLNIDDIHKLGVAFPTKPGEPNLMAFPLVLSMGWKHSPPDIFSSNQHHRLPSPTIKSKAV